MQRDSGFAPGHTAHENEDPGTALPQTRGESGCLSTKPCPTRPLAPWFPPRGVLVGKHMQQRPVRTPRRGAGHVSQAPEASTPALRGC